MGLVDVLAMLSRHQATFIALERFCIAPPMVSQGFCTRGQGREQLTKVGRSASGREAEKIEKLDPVPPGILELSVHRNVVTCRVPQLKQLPNVLLPSLTRPTPVVKWFTRCNLINPQPVMLKLLSSFVVDDSATGVNVAMNQPGTRSEKLWDTGHTRAACKTQPLVAAWDELFLLLIMIDNSWWLMMVNTGYTMGMLEIAQI